MVIDIFFVSAYLYYFILLQTTIGIIVPFLISKKEHISNEDVYFVIWSIILILLGMSLIQVVSAIGKVLNIGLLPDSLSIFTGFFLLMLGIILQGIAIATLGRYYLPYIGTIQEHRVVNKGIYRYIRHPGYFGEMLIFIGFGFVNYNILGILSALLICILIFYTKILPEEKIMLKELGDEYREYMKKTKRFIPFIF